jgi:hypothetical protein
MPTAEATLQTPHARRYVTQFVKHATAMAGAHRHAMRRHGNNPLATGEVTLHLQRTDDRVTATFDPWGSCTLQAEPDRLTLRIDAADEHNLQRIQQIITRDIEGFGRREQLTLKWQRREPTPDPAPGTPPPTTIPTRRARLVLASTGLVAIALFVGVHLGLGGAAVAAWGWLGWTAGGLSVTVLALILGHAAVPVAALRLRRHLSRGSDTP